MNLEQIKQGLLELLFLLQSIGQAQVTGLCQFVNPGPSPNLDLTMLNQLVQDSGSPEIEKLITEANQAQSQQYPNGSSNSIQIEQFTTLWLLFQLQSLLAGLSPTQLMKLFEVVPSNAAPEAQLNILQQLQQLFGDLVPEALQSLQEQIRASPGMELKRLNEIMLLASQDFHLYQPLLGVLQLDTHELLALREVLPQLEYIQLIQLLRLFAEGKDGSYNMMEYRAILVREQPLIEDIQTVQSFAVPPGAPDGVVSDAQIAKVLEDASNGPPPSLPGEKLRLEIVEQPPDKCVYKRNVKPTPTVMIVGDNSQFDGNLYVVPTLLRCDTFEEEPDLITGNKPAKVTTGRVLPFKRLKILCTSHQMKETLFSIRFELRKYKGSEYTVLGTCTSNPIQVLSHSTQLKPAAHSKPVVQEVIPCSGPPSGFTRVAVLGSNFVDSPTTRVKFDKTEVMPIFHGPKTLICHTPRHGPGTVTVHVCNDAKRWSDTAGTFTYDDNIPEEDGKIATYIDTQFNLNIANSICEAAFEGGFETVCSMQEQGADVNQPDARGYSPIHYASANGFVKITAFLLLKGADIDNRDIQFGNTALHYAVEQDQRHVIQLLLDAGATVLPNYQGNTPLHIAAINGNYQVVQKLLVSRGRTTNCAQVNGLTALHAAVQNGDLRSVISLVKFGAFVGVPDNEGDTPLHWAVRSSSHQVLQYLLEQGCDPCPINSDGEAPLALAESVGDLRAYSLLNARLSQTRQRDGATSLLQSRNGNNGMRSIRLGYYPQLKTCNTNGTNAGVASCNAEALAKAFAKVDLRSIRPNTTTRSLGSLGRRPGTLNRQRGDKACISCPRRTSETGASIYGNLRKLRGVCKRPNTSCGPKQVPRRHCGLEMKKIWSKSDLSARFHAMGI